MPTYGAFEADQQNGTTIVRFVENQVPESPDIPDCREQLNKIVTDFESKVVEFQVAGIDHVQGQLLGMMAALTRQGIEVHLREPTELLTGVLQLTKMDRFFTIHNGET